MYNMYRTATNLIEFYSTLIPAFCIQQQIQL